MLAGISRTLPVILVLALAGCGTARIASMYKLSKVDMARTDLTLLRAAVRLPSHVQPLPGGVRLVAEAWREGGGARRRETFMLESVSDARELARLDGFAKHGTLLHAYRLRAEDIPRFDAIRKGGAGGGRSGKLRREISITAEACRRTASMPRRLPMSTYLRTAETREYIPLVTDRDLLRLDDPRTPPQRLPPCPSHG
jgi:hypothetical protein